MVVVAVCLSVVVVMAIVHVFNAPKFCQCLKAWELGGGPVKANRLLEVDDAVSRLSDGGEVVRHHDDGFAFVVTESIEKTQQ